MNGNNNDETNDILSALDRSMLIYEAFRLISVLNDDQLRLLMERMGYIEEKAV